MTKKSSFEMAEEYAIELQEEVRGYGLDQVREAYLAGHAAGLAEAGELVEALEKFEKQTMRGYPIASEWMALEDTMRKTLARFKALAGEKP